MGQSDMKRILVVGGSIGAIILIVFAMIPSIASGHVVQLNEKKINIINSVKDKILNNDFELNGIIDTIYIIIIVFILITNAFLSGHYIY
jgi:hypothetical protein